MKHSERIDKLRKLYKKLGNIRGELETLNFPESLSDYDAELIVQLYFDKVKRISMYD